MSNDYFKFRQFTVRQDHCAMKVGTDGTLLGAWASASQEKCRILDIGTGTGLIALMLAQRFPEAEIVGIDIDPEAIAQARENVAASPFAGRISMVCADVSAYEPAEPFDHIVCNPPFFENALTSPDEQRTLARHTATLSYRTLAQTAFRLLNGEGTISVIVPSDYRSLMEAEAFLAGFFLARLYHVRTVPRKQPRRCLIEYSKQPVKETVMEEVSIEDGQHQRTDWYRQLTKDFYLY